MRNLLLVTLTLLLGCAGQSPPVHPSTEPVFVGDGKIDNTVALQRAVDELSKAGGGTVQFSRGNFLFAGHVNVPNNVTIQGIWASVPSQPRSHARGARS